MVPELAQAGRDSRSFNSARSSVRRAQKGPRASLFGRNPLFARAQVSSPAPAVTRPPASAPRAPVFNRAAAQASASRAPASRAPASISHGSSNSSQSGASETLVRRESVRRSPAQVSAAGVTSMYKLPKFEGLGFSFGREQVFKNNANMMKDSSYSKSGQNGAAFMASLKRYTLNKGCIPNLMIAGHGWGASDGKRESIATGSNSRNANQGLYVDGPGTTIKGHLADSIERGDVKFCGQCQIFLHACSISHNYSETLAKTTGCSVVSADYKVSPVDTDTGVYDHVWFTSAGGKFTKYTPASDRASVSRRSIGEEFIFDPR